jgi:hypothetical protein
LLLCYRTNDSKETAASDIFKTNPSQVMLKLEQNIKQKIILRSHNAIENFFMFENSDVYPEEKDIIFFVKTLKHSFHIEECFSIDYR